MDTLHTRRRHWWLVGSTPLVCNYGGGPGDPDNQGGQQAGGGFGGGGGDGGDRQDRARESRARETATGDSKGGDRQDRARQTRSREAREARSPSAALDAIDKAFGKRAGVTRTPAEILSATDPFGQTVAQIEAHAASGDPFAYGDVTEQGPTKIDNISAALLGAILPFGSLLLGSGVISPEGIMEGRARMAAGIGDSSQMGTGEGGEGGDTAGTTTAPADDSFNSLFDTDIAETIKRLQMQAAALQKSLSGETGSGDSIASITERFRRLRELHNGTFGASE